MARVLVTAALGNVGREVARECAAQGFTVRVADGFPGRTERARRIRATVLTWSRMGRSRDRRPEHELGDVMVSAVADAAHSQ